MVLLEEYTYWESWGHSLFSLVSRINHNKLHSEFVILNYSWSCLLFVYTSLCLCQLLNCLGTQYFFAVNKFPGFVCGTCACLLILCPHFFVFAFVPITLRELLLRIKTLAILLRFVFILTFFFFSHFLPKLWHHAHYLFCGPGGMFLLEHFAFLKLWTHTRKLLFKRRKYREKAVIWV